MSLKYYYYLCIVYCPVTFRSEYLFVLTQLSLPRNLNCSVKSDCQQKIKEIVAMVSQKINTLIICQFEGLGKYLKDINQIEKRSSQLLHNLSGCEKNSGLNGIRTHDLCDAGVVLYQLSYQANWELVILRVRNIPVKDE